MYYVKANYSTEHWRTPFVISVVSCHQLLSELIESYSKSFSAALNGLNGSVLKMKSAGQWYCIKYKAVNLKNLG